MTINAGNEDCARWPLRMSDFRRRAALLLGAIFLIVAGGTIWYSVVEEWSVLDSLYMTVITLTTVGFGEVEPLSRESRIFTVVLILLGVGIVAYGLSSLAQYLVTSGFVERVRREALLRTIGTMENHIIICGAGNVGRTAAESLHDIGREFIVVDSNLETVQALRDDGWTALEGDATRDEILLEAGVERAAGLIVCTSSDADNMFIILAARELNEDLLIVSRSVGAASEAKMRRAGANRVISPQKMGGRQLANMIVRPNVAEFMDHVTLDSGLELWLEEVAIDKKSPIVGSSVVEANIRERTGATLVALLRGEDGVATMPSEETRLESGDRLIVLGTEEQLGKLAELFNSPVRANADQKEVD